MRSSQHREQNTKNPEDIVSFSNKISFAGLIFLGGHLAKSGILEKDWETLIIIDSEKSFSLYSKKFSIKKLPKSKDLNNIK